MRSLFQGFVDVSGKHMLTTRTIKTQGRIRISRRKLSVGKDATGKCFDGAERAVDRSMVQGITFVAVFLVLNVHGGAIGKQ